MRDLDLVPVVALGGAVGAVGRLGIDHALERDSATAWPWATFLINIGGSLALGIVLVGLLRWAERGARWGRWSRPFLVTGVLGGFTTFSAYALQVRDLAAGGAVGASIVYAVSSVVLAVLAVAAGLAIGRRLWPSPSHGAQL